MDTAASTAVCASLEVVTYLCDAIGDDCKGFTGYDTVTNRYHLLSGTTTGSSAAHHTYLKSGTASSRASPTACPATAYHTLLKTVTFSDVKLANGTATGCPANLTLYECDSGSHSNVTVSATVSGCIATFGDLKRVSKIEFDFPRNDISLHMSLAGPHTDSAADLTPSNMKVAAIGSSNHLGL